MSIESKQPFEIDNKDFWNGDAELHETTTINGKVYHVVNHRVERDRVQCNYVAIGLLVMLVASAILGAMEKTGKRSY
ncbi:MAG: hypothetical protein P0S94_03995 [Simkaniaceae bacterium]|nr:hypothetical protein [Simkaniaceae bacterium]